MVSVTLALLASVTAAPSPALGVASHCQQLEPARTATAASKRRFVETADLLRLRDVGRGEDGLWDDSPIAVSPDGKSIAFQVRQADPQSNSYCLAMYLLPLGSQAALGRVDAGGQLLTGTMSIRGLAAVPLGTAKTVVPRWSPDGTAIAYLRGDGGPAQLWLAKRDGSDARALTTSAIDIEDFRWAPDGRSFYVATRPALEAGDRAIREEGLSGFHFDNRFSPAMRSRPFVREPAPLEWALFDPQTGTRTPVTPKMADGLNGLTTDPRLPAGPKQYHGGRVAWASQRAARFNAPRVLHISSPDGPASVCDMPQCEGVVTFGWTRQGDALWYVRRQGFALEEMAIYLWRPGQPPRLVHAVTGILSGCVGAPDAVLCIEETAAQPQRIMRYELASGAQSLLLDLNPEFRSIALGPVRRLHVKTDYGVGAFADLVLPPDHRAGQRHPLIVVQYQSRGFLRGGTGDEAPIFALARQGMAVLSFNRPKDYYTDPAPAWSDFLRAVQHDRIDRRNILSALDRLIDAAVATGTADPERLGIWGLSDGASTAQYALLNSRHSFKAVSLATCCEDPNTYALLGGPVLQDFLRQLGYPSWGGEGDPWAAYSLAQNARRVTVPFLLQLADSEYMKSLEMASAFRDLARPVEMYVFPDERHIKWQPAHRAAIYERNIDWFRFWLLGDMDDSPAKQEQYHRWKEMKDERNVR